ncbi:hypothetical protein HK101_001970 [Irineochytrium annulatum]|nr:hypothetical protein HK101_001970 [Irineochytrium annulatum]
MDSKAPPYAKYPQPTVTATSFYFSAHVAATTVTITSSSDNFLQPKSPQGSRTSFASNASSFSSTASNEPPPPVYAGAGAGTAGLANTSAVSTSAHAVVITFAPCPIPINTRAQAEAAIVSGPRTVEHIQSVLGAYVNLKHVRAATRQPAGEYRFSTQGVIILTVPSSTKVMHKLEKLSWHVLVKRRYVDRELYLQALHPFRRRLYGELCDTNADADAFGHAVWSGRIHFPTLTDRELFHIRAGVRVNWATLCGSRQRNLKVDISTLRQVHTVFLVDDSGSMHGPGHSSWGGGSDYAYNRSGRMETRWDQVRDLMMGMVEIIAQQDPEGVDIHFLNVRTVYRNVRTRAEVLRIFTDVRPTAGTYTGARVGDILDAYMSTLRYEPSIRPLSLVIYTDGETSDEETLHHTIESHVTHIMHRGYPGHQLGLEFIQVGDDQEATRHLRKLEDEVSRHHLRFQRDVVGVTPVALQGGFVMNPENAIQILLSGVDARMNGYLRQRAFNV